MTEHENPRVRGEFLHSDITERIIGGFFEVYDELGYGFLESNYTEALSRVLTGFGLRVAREVPIDVLFRKRSVGRYRLDMVVDDKVIVEVKATRALVEADERQLQNYLRATPMEVGLLLHFGPKPAVRRRAFTNAAKPNMIAAR